MRVWRIRELLNSEEIVREGRALCHCVASYAYSCHVGKVFIWTMSVETDEGSDKQFTIEVNNETRTICQARGKRNRRPTQAERDILTRWAQQAGLQIADHV